LSRACGERVACARRGEMLLNPGKGHGVKAIVGGEEGAGTEYSRWKFSLLREETTGGRNRIDLEADHAKGKGSVRDWGEKRVGKGQGETSPAAKKRTGTLFSKKLNEACKGKQGCTHETHLCREEFASICVLREGESEQSGATKLRM